ncbi:glycosyltransferase [bacterium 1xD8-48]|nr:glycosyltransferase [bacterium 1xD8-48]
MDKTELISVIVPVYNIEKYIERCIESITSQTYSNLEIILVDDGSADDSGRICDRYKIKDPRINVIHKCNGGLSTARNAGIARAKGDYIGFVDGDDYISQDMYEKLLWYMKEDVDITCCGRTYILPRRKRREYCLGRIEKFSKTEAIEEILLSRKICISACTKLFRRNLFDDLRFPTGRICEDIPTVYNLIKRARNLIHIGEAKYFYYYRENSISHKEFYPQRTDYIVFMKYIYKDVKKNYPQLILQAEAGYIISLLNTLDNIEQCGGYEKYSNIKNKITKMIRKVAIGGLINPYVGDEQKKKIIRHFLGIPIKVVCK